MNIGGSISGALFSDDNRRFRYALWRIWDKSKDALLFIGLNPSTANYIKDDPTVRCMVAFAKLWGYGGLYIGNLFSLVSSDPSVLYFDTSVEWSGGPNNTAIKRMRMLSTLVLVGWGAWGINAGVRPAEVINLVGEPVYCLKVTRQGEPAHPLYLRRDSKLIRYYRRGEHGNKRSDS